MRTANWIVSFNLIMSMGEINKQTSYRSHRRDSFQIVLQVSVHGELVALKALGKKKSNNTKHLEEHSGNFLSSGFLASPEWNSVNHQQKTRAKG